LSLESLLPLSEQVGWQWALDGRYWVFCHRYLDILRLRLGSSSHQTVVLPTSSIQTYVAHPFCLAGAVFMGLQSLLLPAVAVLAVYLGE
jgi:CP family cyanate transporter-like MFS transporter